MYAHLGRLARSLQTLQASDLDSDRLLRVATEMATEVLPGVAHAGVTLVVNRRRRTLETVAATGKIPRTIDRLQDEHQQGPILESLWNQYTIRVDDYEKETRWPGFVADIVEQTPVRSSLSIQLYTDEHELGKLNLYSEQAANFTPEVEELALALAAQAAVGLASARSSDELRSALASRDIIGQAKGIIMESYDVSSAEAFILLTKLSQESNTPVYEVARKLVFAERPSR
ncbi:ANTAR domain-containing protein [Mycobacterium bourgelatii]|nr:ANTAR domain-containing protein [Mycobacterium bourgelatii]MCV6977143.1 ANTAR domain-containing protein [Mycobacterium bourgelatii]